MGGERFQEQDTDSFFGNFVYDRVIPQDHFLRQLEGLVTWEKLTKRLVRLYRGKARQGRPPYDPSLLLKMLLVAYLYDLAERQTEEVVNYNLPVKWFVGLAVDEPAPDHSTLTRFKGRLVERGNLEAVEGLLQEVIALALEAGIAFGSVQVMDSVHTVANVNPEKDRRRQERDDEPPLDGDAQWGVKGSRRKGPKRGSGSTVNYFYGFKAHCSFNAEAELITSVEVTPGNRHDGQLPQVW